MSEPTDRFKAENYGEVLAVIKDLELVSYEEHGSYQGDYLVILKDKHRLFYFEGSYGSCSGCDWLEDVKQWDDDDNDQYVTYKEARDYCADLQPLYIVPIDKPLDVKYDDEEYEWRAV